MKRIRKLQSKRGETFVEILIAILIVAFGCVLIATMYAAAMNMNVKASKQDDDYYGALSEIEQMFDGEAKARGKAVLTDKSGNTVTDSIDTFGNDKNAAYKRR